MSSTLDPDLKRFKKGDPAVAMILRQEGRGAGKRFEAEINKHHKLVSNLQKLNFMKGVKDEQSALGWLDFEDYLFEQVKLLNFIYMNIFTRYHKQEKILSKQIRSIPRGLPLQNKPPSSDEDDDSGPVQFRTGSETSSKTPWVASKKKNKSKKRN